MNEELKNNKLISLANDKLMLEAVYDLGLEVFLKKKSGEDVSMKAGRFIAIELLQEWRTEIEKYVIGNKKEEKASGNVGL